MSQVSAHIQQRPRRDSNPRTRLRRPMLYPLSYEGRRRQGSAHPLRCRTGQRRDPARVRLGYAVTTNTGGTS
jgi:hypothetical protein